MSEETPVRAALVVGINAYSSLGDAGQADLKGARNDAISWAVAARSLGITQIHLLTSPPLSPAEVPLDPTGIVFGEATEAAILAGVKALAQVLGSAEAEEGQGQGQGLVAYSGHGAEDGRGLLLCPADVRPDLANAIPYAAVAALLDQHAPQTNVTFFLDTCHAAPPDGGLRLLHSPGRRSLVHAGTARPDHAPRRGLRDTDLVVAACRTNETSAEAFLQSKVHGAFTWAATAVLSRGGLAQDAESGLSFFGVSYRTLLQRTHGLLQSLGFPQRPVLEGPVFLADLPVMHPRTLLPVRLPAGGTAPTMTRELFPEEGEGGSPMNFAIYQINAIGGGTLYGYLLTTADQAVSFQGATWAAKREYWMWQGNNTWSTQGFQLSLITPNNLPPGTTLSPTQAIQLESKPFPPLSQSASLAVNQNNAPWWSISFTATPLASQIGWLKVHAGEKNNWYEYTDVTWWSSGGQSVAPMQWFTIVQPNSPGTYQNQVLYFHYAPGGPNANTDSHPGDGTAPTAGQYVLSHIVKIQDAQLAPSA